MRYGCWMIIIEFWLGRCSFSGSDPFDKTCEYGFYMNAMWVDAVYYAGAVASNQIVYVSPL